MNLDRYLEIRRRFNIVRQETPVQSRIIFDELAILCTLHATRGLTATQLADGQGISCPTMTHRGSHLTHLGYMSRSASDEDHRKLRCVLTRKGASYIARIAQTMLSRDVPECLAHLDVSDLIGVIAKMGTLPMTADALTLLCFAHEARHSMPITDISTATGLLQPTVSMAVLRLEEAGCIEGYRSARLGARRPMRRGQGCILTDAGFAAALEVSQRVEAL